MRLTQKQLSYHIGGRGASELVHKALANGCSVVHNSKGKRMIDICELITKTKDSQATMIAEKLRIKLELK